MLKKLPKTFSQESTNALMNETRKNLLQQNKAEKVGGKEKEERR